MLTIVIRQHLWLFEGFLASSSVHRSSGCFTLSDSRAKLHAGANTSHLEAFGILWRARVTANAITCTNFFGPCLVCSNRKWIWNHFQLLQLMSFHARCHIFEEKHGLWFLSVSPRRETWIPHANAAPVNSRASHEKNCMEKQNQKSQLYTWKCTHLLTYRCSGDACGVCENTPTQRKTFQFLSDLLHDNRRSWHQTPCLRWYAKLFGFSHQRSFLFVGILFEIIIPH